MLNVFLFGMAQSHIPIQMLLMNSSTKLWTLGLGNGFDQILSAGCSILLCCFSANKKLISKLTFFSFQGLSVQD